MAGYLTTVACSLILSVGRAHVAIAASPAPLEISGPWLRLPPPGVKVTAGYMTLHNSGNTTLTITGISTTKPTHVELHNSRLTKDGQMSMEQAHAVTVAPGATVRLAPAGMHAMIFDAPTLAAGGTLDFTLELQDGRRVKGAFTAQRP